MLLFAVSLPAVTARLYSSDEVEYFSYLRSLYVDGDVSFENEYRYFYDRGVARSAGFHETFLERQTAAGRRVNYATVGAAILWSPFYAAADGWTRITGGTPDGYGPVYLGAVAYGSAVYAFLAVLLSIRAARLCLSNGVAPDGSASRASTVAGLAVWFGTPLLFYMYVAPPFAHACSAFAVALFLNVWLYVRRRWTAGGAFALGLTVALATMVREQDAFLALPAALDFAWSAWRPADPRQRHSLPRLAATAAAGTAGAALGYLPQLVAYRALNGYFGPAEHVARKMSWYAPHALEVLASPQHGFLFWTPLAALGLAGLCLLRDRRIAVLLLLMVASQVYVAGSVESWTVAGAFGQRRFVNLTAILVIGLAALWQAAAGTTRRAGVPRPYALGAVVVLCVWWNVALMAQFATRLMDRQRLDLPRNAYHAFVTLPVSGPSLAWRYLTDRASFYDATPAAERR